MQPGTYKLPLLDQREIEAKVVGPLVRAFAEETGEHKALRIVGGVVRDLARQAGAELSRQVGECGLRGFAQTLERWQEGGALEIEVLERTPNRLYFNVTRCKYAEMYRALGMADLGASLSCQRDYALAQGFNSEIDLTRTQTIMEGAAYCDFRFELEESEVERESSRAEAGVVTANDSHAFVNAESNPTIG